MKRFKGSDLEKIVKSFWVYFFTTDWGTTGMCGTSYGLGTEFVIDFYFPNGVPSGYTITAVEIIIP